METKDINNLIDIFTNDVETGYYVGLSMGFNMTICFKRVIDTKLSNNYPKESKEILSTIINLKDFEHLLGFKVDWHYPKIAIKMINTYLSWNRINDPGFRNIKKLLFEEIKKKYGERRR